MSSRNLSPAAKRIVLAAYVAIELFFVANYHWQLGLLRGDPKMTVIVGFVIFAAFSIQLYVPIPGFGREADRDRESKSDPRQQ